jgi:hypothetical protein
MKTILFSLKALAVVVLVVISSCSTMQEYEAQRQQRLLDEYKARLRAEVLVRKAEAEAEKLAKLPPVEQVAVAKEPDDAYAALSGPTVEPEIRTRQELDAVLPLYEAYVSLAERLATEIAAFGIKAYISRVDKFREASELWIGWWRRFQVFPRDEDISREDMESFYVRVQELDAKNQAATAALNKVLRR